MRGRRFHTPPQKTSLARHLTEPGCPAALSQCPDEEERLMATAPAVSGTYSAAVYPTAGASPPLTVSRFTAAQTPGNVAVCLTAAVLAP